MKLWANIADYYPSTSIEILFINTPTFFKLVRKRSLARAAQRASEHACTYGTWHGCMPPD
jgi:hypothetical protein